MNLFSNFGLRQYTKLFGTLLRWWFEINFKNSKVSINVGILYQDPECVHCLYLYLKTFYVAIITPSNFIIEKLVVDLFINSFYNNAFEILSKCHKSISFHLWRTFNHLKNVICHQSRSHKITNRAHRSISTMT